ncbi:MAG: DUF2800 domain-containing protein [Bifidobacteriaceae bacterium]|nr:DUF2800 domain-containing protein [Bifidobacteriaceae bacterium]
MGAHALLAPSSAKRWMTCTPSARLEATVPNKDTAYTREGTIAHAMAEAMLLHLLSIDAEAVPDYADFMLSGGEARIMHQINDCNEEKLDWKDMAETVYEHYVRLVYEAYLGAKLEDPDAVLLVESKLRLAEFIPEGFGSSDAVLIYGDTLEVFDLKYGKGVKVEAEENAQMMCYALGAYLGPGELYEINRVRMTIIQPRLRHESSWTMSATDLMTWAKDELAPAALKAWNGEGEQTPGEHCRFCKVAAKCKALANYTLGVTEDKTEPGLMSLEEIAKLLPHFATIKSWINSVEEFALEAALEGDSIPGYKIVEGRSVRKISNAAEAIQRLEGAGIPSENYLKPAELKTITDLEKTLTKKGFKTILGDLVIKPEGKPTLVEEADPREPFSKAKNDFKDIIENL